MEKFSNNLASSISVECLSSTMWCLTDCLGVSGVEMFILMSCLLDESDFETLLGVDPSSLSTSMIIAGSGFILNEGKLNFSPEFDI